MEGPTPVSALIHAATMVTAGVYMVARTNALFVLSPFAMGVVATIGTLTLLLAGSIAIAQNDIKRVLAYSTVSQLGYMFLAAGVGAYTAAIFHLVTHAFFKALLFLGSGSVIHSLHGEQDIRRMGGLRAGLPVTSWTFTVGALAIAGIFPFAGFFSKDAILFAAMTSPRGGLVFWLAGAAGAFMTAFYMFRLIFMTFHGEMRVDHHAREHIHESPATMTVPLVILAVLSVVGGVIPGFPPDAGWIHKFLAPSLAKAPGAHAALDEGVRVVKAAAQAGAQGGGHGTAGIALIVLAIAVALGGIALAWRMYLRDTAAPARLERRFPGLYRLLLNKYYVDEIYQACIVEPIYRLMRALFDFDQKVVDGAVNGSSFLTVWFSRISGIFDLRTVDGAVNGTAGVIGFFSQLFKFIQSGMVQNYLFVMLLGVFLMVSAYLFR